MKDGQELVEVPESPIDLFAAYSDPLAELEEKNLKVKFDISTYEGETACKKYIAKVGKFRIGVEALRKSLKREFIDKGNAVDVKAKLYQARIAAIDAVHSEPLKALENKRVQEMLDIQEAEKAEERKLQEAKDAELEKLRKIVADQEAAAKAIEDAAKIEADKLEAVEAEKRKAKADAINAKVLADKKVQDAVAAEKKRVADKYAKEQAEQAKIEKANQARIADEGHRREFNNLAVAEISKITQNEAMSMSIVKAIVRGEIPNVTLNY